MSDPFRLRVLKALTAQIKSVTPTNGYQHDLADYVDDDGQTRARVFRGRDIFGFSDPLPMVSILEDVKAKEQSDRQDAPFRSGQYELLIQGFVQDDPDNPTDPAHLLAADVITAVIRARSNKRDILGLGGRLPCVEKISVGAPVIRPADDTISSVAFFFLNVTLTLSEDLENPFA